MSSVRKLPQSFWQINVFCLMLLALTMSCVITESGSYEPVALAAQSPADTSYLIDSEWIQLTNGRAERQAAPGSEIKTIVALFGKTTKSDLNNDGHDDALLFLTYEGGGSGTFFYLAAAIEESGRYRGTNGVWLGDRIKAPMAQAQNGLITISYLERLPGESMAVAPSRVKKRYFVLDRTTLKEINPAAGGTVLQGWLTIGHEVRSFRPCDEDALWLMGDQAIMVEIFAYYKKSAAGLVPYAPVFATLSGKKTRSPKDGFGADYQGAFAAGQVVRSWPNANCKGNLIIVESPQPGATIFSPLTIAGRARGPWFFEGDFPVILADSQGNPIATSYATAQEAWMTREFVAFKGVLEFHNFQSGSSGTLILKKNNPTSKAQFDNDLEIPINFQREAKQ